MHVSSNGKTPPRRGGNEGSIPPTCMLLSSVGRTLCSERRCREFDPLRSNSRLGANGLPVAFEATLFWVRFPTGL